MNRTKIHLLHTTLCLCAAWLICTTTACTDRIETDTILPDDGETIEVNVRLGFAPEENAATATDTRTYTGKAKGQAFSAQLQAEANTRETTEEYTTPDGLYELNVIQLSADGTKALASSYQSGKTDIGSMLTLSLQPATDCQLVIIARGKDASNAAINPKTLPDLQALSFDRDVIDAIPTSGATQEQMNAMPYVLHLKHVTVVTENNVGKLQSPDVNADTGAQDVRLMLKRLAAKVTVNWNYDVTVTDKYTLKQLLLQSVPLKFNYIPAPNKDDGSYPDVMDQYTTLTVKNTYIVSDHQTDGTYSFWVPANVRADNPEVSSALLRTKDNAPAGSSYLTFEAVSNKNVNKKFRYRIYIGDDNPQNFSIRQNTDYIYNIDFKHTGIPVQDRRVTYVDPIPASQNNNNFVPTANCFMVKPGGSFCFDPFLFRSGGKDITNDVLAGWITAGTATRATGDYGIQYVRLLWQTKEKGDLGEPVMGIVNSNEEGSIDHTNIVEIKPVGGSTLNPEPNAFTAANQCRIYCRVAPGTTGGNGVIAAYDTEGKILWSWHIWVTDYNPDCTGKEEVLGDVNKRKLKFDYNNAAANQLPMMDRNLGAMAGYVDVPATQTEKSKTNGLHYQWGRKDPFPSTYTNRSNFPDITIPSNATKPIEGLLNLYSPDGVTFLPFQFTQGTTDYRGAYQKPRMLYKYANPNYPTWRNAWFTDFEKAWGTTKTVHDPSPAGWRVVQMSELLSLFMPNNLTLPATNGVAFVNIKNDATVETDGGILLYYDAKQSKATFMPFTGTYKNDNEIKGIGTEFYMWTCSHKSSNETDYQNGRSVYCIRCLNTSANPVEGSTAKTGEIYQLGYEREPLPLRCIQESAQ